MRAISLRCRAAILATLAIVLLAGALSAETRVIDGDGLDIDGSKIRLFGIDAPEWGDPGGQEAAGHLRRLVDGRHVECREVERDRYGRSVSLCSAGGAELSQAMILAGHAVVYCRYVVKRRPDLLPVLLAAQAKARAARLGLWSRPFQPWRDWGCDK